MLNNRRYTPSTEAGQSGFPYNPIKLGFIILGTVFFLTLLIGSYEIVPPGHRGIVIHAGSTSETVLEEGFTFKVPLYTTIKSVSVRVRETSIKTQAASKDMQKVHTILSLNWHISSDKVNTVFKQIGEAEVIEANIISKQVSEVLKSATATMSAEEILGKRTELKDKIDEDLIKRLAKFNITVDNVNLADFDFEPQFNEAVEKKQIAEQRAKQAEYEAQKAEVDARAAVNKAKGEAEAKLTLAEAEAKANNLKQKTLTRELIQYETVQRWDGKLPQVSGAAGTLINIPGTKE